MALFMFRYFLAFISFYGMLVVFLTRTDLNIAVITMNNCTAEGNYFCWSSAKEEILLASYFIGYLLQLPGGYLAQRAGAKHVYGCGLGFTVLLCFLTPIAAKRWGIILVLRVLQGIGAAVTFPAMTAMWARWAPRYEKSALCAISNSGHFIGAALADSLSGVLCEGDLFGGWPAVFYIFGIVGVVWYILWIIFMSSSPEDNRWISRDEKNYITENRSPLQIRQPTPWRWVLTSPKCWAIYIAHFTNNYGYYMMLVCIPQYLVEVYSFDIKNTGIIAAAPHLAMFIVANIIGQLTDCLLRKQCIGITLVRKLNTIIGMAIPGVIYLVIALVSGLTKWTIVGLLITQQATNGFIFSGYLVNYIDVNPDQAGVTGAIGNSIATLSGIIAPLIVNRIEGKSHGEKNIDKSWNIVFITVGIVMLFGALIFGIFATGENQVMEDGYEPIPGTIEEVTEDDVEEIQEPTMYADSVSD